MSNGPEPDQAARLQRPAAGLAVDQLLGFRIGVTSDRRSGDLIAALERRGAQVLHAMIEPMALEVMADRGVVTWDMCAANDARGFGQTYMKLLEAFGDVTTEVIDRQTYYAATYHGPRSGTPGAATAVPEQEGPS